MNKRSCGWVIAIAIGVGGCGGGGKASAPTEPAPAPSPMPAPAPVATPAPAPTPSPASPPLAACVDPSSIARPWPVPPTDPSGNAATIRVGKQLQRGWFLCDLPDRVIVGGPIQDPKTGAISGSLWSVDRATPAHTTVAPLSAKSEGCQGMMKCDYVTTTRGLTHVRVHTDARVTTDGAIGDGDKLATCRGATDTALAMCVTRTHSVVLDFADCNTPTGGEADLALVLRVYAAARGKEIETGETPTTIAPAHVADPTHAGNRWVYRSTGDGKPVIELAIAAGDSRSATLTIDGAAEDCLAFTLAHN